MRVFTSGYWEEQLEFMRLPLHERLLREAEAEDRAAKQLENCTWSGYQHPSQSHRDRASDLRAAALRIQMLEEAPRRRREAAERRRAQRRQELQDSMIEDRDW